MQDFRPQPETRAPRTRTLALGIGLALFGSVSRAESDRGAAELVRPALIEPAASEILPLDEIERGQVGYGLSVFAGSEPVRFQVEVLGLQHHSTPEISYVLARLSGQDLERSGVLGGMSGSPVYIDGRLVGAVAFSYLFGLDPIAGITPIGAMRSISETPLASLPTWSPRASGLMPDLDSLVQRKFNSDSLQQALAQMGTRLDQGARTAVQWSAGGFGGQALDMLQEMLGPLGPVLGGSTSRSVSTGGAGSSLGAPSTPASGLGSGQGRELRLEGETGEPLGPGSAVAALLVGGDLSLAAHGTVTERRGDEILAFGHPMFGLGPVRVPMAKSEVITTIPSRFNSFKLSNAGPVIGAIDQDREAGVRGRIGLDAPTIPFTVHLRGLVDRDYRMEVAELPLLTPALFSLATLGAINAGSYAIGPQGVDLEIVFRMRGHQPLRLQQSFDGVQAATDATAYVLSFAAFLLGNEQERVSLENVEVTLEQSNRPRTATLRAARASRHQVRPGQEVGIELEIQPYQGAAYRHQLQVEIPMDAPEGAYYLMVGDGNSMDAARLAVEQRQPQRFEQSLELLRSFRSQRQLAVYGLLVAPGLSVAGTSMPRLPGSARSLLEGGVGNNGSGQSLAIHFEQLQTLDRPLNGIFRLDLEIKDDA